MFKGFLAQQAMGLSSFCVVSNVLRLNLVKVYDGSRDRKIGQAVTGKIVSKSGKAEDVTQETGNKEKHDISQKEDREMQIKVTGMMCAHCEAHVKKALEAIDGIESAVASHEQNSVTITTTKDVDEAQIKNAVVDAGYEYGGIVA